MKKTVWIFPGQGAQAAGMGKDFYEQSPAARAVFDEACEILGEDYRKLCFEKDERLDRTDYTQPALLITCAAMLKEITRQGFGADLTAGLSLGEYTALHAAGAADLKDLLETVALRGKLMQASAGEGKGGMAAVLGLDGETVREALIGIEGAGVANYNCPGQVVITGSLSGIEKAGEVLKKAGARRIMPLKVSGPFHSPFMQPAADRMKARLEQIAWRKPLIPYVTNVHAGIVREAEPIGGLLYRQICSSVLWEQSVRTMEAWGAEQYIEIGPGRTLTKFMARIAPKARVYSISSVEEMHSVLEKLGNA